MNKSELGALKIEVNKIHVIAQDLCQEGTNGKKLEINMWRVVRLADSLELIRKSIESLNRDTYNQCDIIEDIKNIAKDEHLFSSIDFAVLYGIDYSEDPKGEWNEKIVLAREHLKVIRDFFKNDVFPKNDEDLSTEKEKEDITIKFIEMLSLPEGFNPNTFTEELLKKIGKAPKDYTLYPLALESEGYIGSNARADVWNLFKETYSLKKTGSDRNHRKLISDYTNSEQIPLKSKLGPYIEDVKKILEFSKAR